MILKDTDVCENICISLTPKVVLGFIPGVKPRHLASYFLYMARNRPSRYKCDEERGAIQLRSGSIIVTSFHTLPVLNPLIIILTHQGFGAPAKISIYSAKTRWWHQYHSKMFDADLSGCRYLRHLGSFCEDAY